MGKAANKRRFGGHPVKIKVTIGLDNYTGDMCGFHFESSVCIVDDDGSLRVHRLLTRLQALFAGTKVENAEEMTPAQVPTQEANPEVPVADFSAPATPAQEVIEEERPRRKRTR
jgi:hypothetical protein